MADDKGGSSGGGSSWSALEIIIGIVLLIGLLDRFSATIRGVPAGTSTDKASVSQSDANARCGLSLFAPVEGQKVSRDVSVEGIAGTCNWEVDSDIALFAQVIDAKGAPLSDYTPIYTRYRNESTDKVEFAGVVAVTTLPTTKSGYLILVPATEGRQGHTTTVRVPLALK